MQKSEERWDSSVQTLRSFIKRPEVRWDHSLETHRTLSKVKGELGPQCTNTQDLYLNIREEVGNRVYRNSGHLTKG